MLMRFPSIPRRIFCLILFLAVSVGVSSAQNTTAEYSGSGIKNTRPFTVDGPWEVRWDADGSVFQIFLHDTNGTMQGVLANQQGPGRGSSFQPTPGRYYLQVNAVGKWEIEVVEGAGDDAASSSSSSESTASGAIASYSGSGAKNTRPVSIDGPWELQWDADGQIFQVYLYTADGSMAGVLANQQGAGTGSSFHPRGGRYYFQVNALGRWSMKVVSAQ